MIKRLVKKAASTVAATVVSLAAVSAVQNNSAQLSTGAAFAALGSALTSPDAAAAAWQQLLQPGATPPPSEDSEDVDAGFWTQLPTAAEVLATPTPAPPETTEQAQEPAVQPEGSLPIQQAHYSQGQGNNYISSGAAGTIKNCTSLSAAEIAAQVGQPLPFSVQLNSAEPQVLIMHTHATETYQLDDNLWYDPSFSARSTDTAVNMVAVGAEIAAQLNAAGVCTVQDATLHDYPSYNGSYERSNQTVRGWLEKYPSIKVVLDIHRDAIEYEDGTRVKPVADIGGMSAAQVMIICGADSGGNLPNFKQNLTFAAALENQMESLFPGLTRPVLFDYRYYNQDLTTGSLLLEMGGHANTLEEAKYSGRLVGQALAALFGAG